MGTISVSDYLVEFCPSHSVKERKENKGGQGKTREVGSVGGTTWAGCNLAMAAEMKVKEAIWQGSLIFRI